VTRPIPVPDDRSAPYWIFAARHELAIARCSRCGQFSHPPDVVCPHCRSSDPAFVLEPVSGRGRVRSWTVVRQSFLAGFTVPFLLVDVQLVEQPDLRLIGRLIDGPDAALALGDAVRVTFEDVSPDVSVPAFILDASA
jgi:uncharacterized OB-fold protein